MQTLRKPFFVAALVLVLLVVLVEAGAVELIRGGAQSATAFLDLVPKDDDLTSALDDLDDDELQELLSQDRPPGLAIRYMALLDGVLLFTVGLIGMSLLIRERLHARVQGCLTAIFSLMLIIGTIALILVALALVILMLSLFLAVPFGTLAYLAIYGFFNRGGAAAALALLMALKLGSGVCLVVAQPRFLQNRGLVLLFLTSLLGNVVISFLHGLVPIILVSITDGVAAIVVAILAVIWALVLLIGSIPAVIKALRPDRV